MVKPKEYFHLVTNKKLELGQKILFNKDTNNRLYDFFFKKEFRNNEGRDCFDIIKSGSTPSGLSLNEEDTKIIHKYNDITIRGIRELIVEMVRLKYYPNYPSRLNCLYVSKTYEDLLKWKEIFESYNRKILQLVKLQSNGDSFEGDGELLPKEDGVSFDKKMSQAKEYWESNNNCGLSEVLLDGEIEVIKIINEYE